MRRGGPPSPFETHGAQWWDGSASFLRLLANLVPARMRYFDQIVPAWRGRSVLDLGSGGGFMAEELARRGARVVGLDPALAALAAGRRHAAGEGLRVAYLAGLGEELPLASGSFDAVVCVDVLEHVERWDLVVGEAARVLRPGGTFLFDTVNRTWLARLVLVHLAEGALRLLPRGTHDPRRFLRPEELARTLRARGLQPGPLAGLGPAGLDGRLTLTFRRLPSLALLYLGSARKG